MQAGGADDGGALPHGGDGGGSGGGRVRQALGKPLTFSFGHRHARGQVQLNETKLKE